MARSVAANWRTLRAELLAKTAVIAHLRAELNRTTVPVLETTRSNRAAHKND